MIRRVGTALAVAVLVATTLAACTSSGGGKGTSSPPPSSGPTAGSPTSVPASSVPVSTVPPSDAPSESPASARTGSSAARASAATSPPLPAPASTVHSGDTTAAAPFVTTCARLTVRVIPGGAERGAEIAALQFENNGSTRCTISGVPTVTLLRAGMRIGTRSQPTGRPAHTLRLAAGDVAESLLQDFSTCQAPLSDHARVTGPRFGNAAGVTVVAPVQLRACTLRAAPVGPPS